MRTHITLLCLLTVAGAVQAQSPTQSFDDTVQVRTLTIVSNDLPDAERMQIVQAIQGHSYPLSEVSERVLQHLRDHGYANAHAEIPQLAAILLAPPAKSLDLTVQISAGAIYTLSEIRFEHASFRPDVLRSQFSIADGSVFNATAIGKGLDNLKNAYQSLGFINFGAIPKLQYDEAHHTVALTIDIDEGAQYFFGRLLLDGVEPHPGMTQALEAAWKPLEGGNYNPRILAQWLGKNATFIPNAQAAPEKYVSVLIDDDGHRVNVQLEFP
jgi:outer membrane translocation and assembly module TamA